MFRTKNRDGNCTDLCGYPDETGTENGPDLGTGSGPVLGTENGAAASRLEPLLGAIFTRLRCGFGKLGAGNGLENGIDAELTAASRHQRKVTRWLAARYQRAL